MGAGASAALQQHVATTPPHELADVLGGFDAVQRQRIQRAIADQQAENARRAQEEATELLPAAAARAAEKSETQDDEITELLPAAAARKAEKDTVRDEDATELLPAVAARIAEEDYGKTVLTRPIRNPDSSSKHRMLVEEIQKGAEEQLREMKETNRRMRERQKRLQELVGKGIRLELSTGPEDFTVTSQLGQGGFGTVFAVESGGQKFAAKLMPDEIQEAEESLVVEALTLARLRQEIRENRPPGKEDLFLPSLRAIGRCEDIGALVVVMEQAAATAKDSIKGAGKPLDVQQVASLAWALARTLAFMNEMGFVHGDLKPDNILLTFDDEGQMWPLLADFGTATSLADSLDTKQLRPNDVVPASAFTHTYAAPEVSKSVFEERGCFASPITDIYSFGLLGQQLLDACPPSGDDELKKELQQLFETCSSQKPQDRPQGFRVLSKRILGLQPSRGSELHAWSQKLALQQREGEVSDRPRRMHAVKRLLNELDPFEISEHAEAEEATITQLCDMGFERAEVQRALEAAFGNPDRAVEYLMSGIPTSVEQAAAGSHPAAGGTAPAAAAAAADAPTSATGGGGPPPRDQVVRLTEKENAAVDRLVALGFDKDVAEQVYLACEKDEETAANLLLSSV
eukprot:TRINITY_DN1257_c1_g1_i7.p1 TRINITY_DN1257_c1_g1~~TRINITY_DN1257_c1_g1_i7.p1  ORF type:complete len:631 (+),score=178.52 TRINITY_DN1257_c1_g1_i7:97-1989(+)